VTRPSNQKILIISPKIVYIEGWLVKVSMSSLGSICLVMINPNTNESYTQFFTDELKANQFIIDIVES
jgi:hypothetical protein